MKKLLFAFALVLACTQMSTAIDPGWPRQIVKQGSTLVYYQPQVDEWKGFKELDARIAFSLTPAGGKPVVGVMTLHAQTDVAPDNDTVLLSELRITNTNFPALDPAEAASMSQLVKTFVPRNMIISLRRLVACVNKPVTAQSAPLKNDPPEIFISYKPAILLQLDGNPVLAPVDKTKLEVVVNTRWRAFFDEQRSRFYLYTGQQWLESASLAEGWAVAEKLPKDFSKLPSQPGWEDLKKAVPPPKTNKPAPAVFYSTVPAELIMFNGQPVYESVPGTQLVHATNANGPVFVYKPASKIYYLTAGRWFSASSLQGPWSYATPDLPSDFARIPATGPLEDIRASVPGTPEARDAVLLAQIPTTVVVNPASAAQKVKVTYGGEPKFAPIEGTSMQYAVNTPDKVIKVGDVYYLCFQGVWFISTSPQGPWTTAVSVPQEIYTIPPSSPVYNVTYVTQTKTSDGNVESSYTAGYLGAFMIGTTVGIVIANGTGYYYPPYFYYPPYAMAPIYYPRPYAYGGVPYYNTVTGAYGYRGGAYGPYGGATWGGSYNPDTGTYARGASVSTPYGTRSAGQAYNPYTGAYGATRQGSNAYSQWGSSVVTRGDQAALTQHYSTAQGTVGSIQGSGGGKAVAGAGASGSGFAGRTASGDMYAGRDGNVYKNTGGGWQKYDNGSWSSVNKPTQSTYSAQSAQQRAGTSFSGSNQTQGLNQEFQNRQRGAYQSQQFQRSGSGRSWGGGGMRSGGRRR